MVDAGNLYTVEPLHPLFGGIIKDLDLSDPSTISAAVRTQIKIDLHRYRFLVVRAPTGVQVKLNAE